METGAAPSSASQHGPPTAGGMAGGTGCAAKELKVKMPIQVTIPRTEERSSMLKAYTAYVITVSDFGHAYEIEKRFDDFQRLHADLSSLVDDNSLPALPEKKMFASTSADVVAERKPQFEKLLRYALRREEIVNDTRHCIAKFLEIPVPAMVALRYLMSKGKRYSYIRQCWKLLEKQFVKEHAWRLCHESVIRTNLHLMSSEGAIPVPGSSGGSADAAANAADSLAGEPGGDAEAAEPAKLTEADIETSVIDMVKHAIAEGDAEARRCFMEENGIAVVLGMMLRLVKKAGAASGPDKRLKSVLTALIQVEGENFPVVFKEFLNRDGITELAAFKDLCSQQASFAEFMGKALWLAWEPETQQAFLQANPSAEGDALALLGALFSSSSKSGQLLAGLLISTLIANGLFSHDRDREAKAAAGLVGLVEDLVVAMPMAGAGGTSNLSEEDLKAAEAVIGGTLTSRSERAFSRILNVACAPFQGMEVGEDHPLWSACSFALWFLTKAQPKPERIQRLRPLLTGVAQAGPHRARWLAAQLLLQLHMPINGSSGVAQFSSEDGIGASATFDEQAVVEAVLAEQVSVSVDQLQAGLEQNRGVIAQQSQLASDRQHPLAIDGSGNWSADLNAALKHLAVVRRRLGESSGTLQDKEKQSTDSLANLSKTLQVDSDSSRVEAERTLRNVQDLEGVFLAKKNELALCEEELQVQNSVVEQCSAEVEVADKAVADMRKRVFDMEQEVSKKQREAQYQRTLASSDFTALRNQLSTEMEQLEKKITSIKEKGQKLQSSDAQGADAEKVSEVLAKLKQELQQSKQRQKEVQSELQQLQVDPADITEKALRLESEAGELLEGLSRLRTHDLNQLEQGHATRREAWQRENGRLQDVRFKRDAAERECLDLRRQLDERWRLWKPAWGSRLNHWSERAKALSGAEAHGRHLDEALQTNWGLFREEQEARAEVLSAVGKAQQQLAELAEQIASLGDLQ